MEKQLLPWLYFQFCASPKSIGPNGDDYNVWVPDYAGMVMVPDQLALEQVAELTQNRAFAGCGKSAVILRGGFMDPTGKAGEGQ